MDGESFPSCSPFYRIEMADPMHVRLRIGECHVRFRSSTLGMKHRDAHQEADSHCWGSVRVRVRVRG